MTSAHRIVVVGHGMVAARFVEELDRAVPPGRLEMTVLGAEPYAPYNRLLLSEVLAGRADVAGLTLPEAPRHVRVLAGLEARRIDRVHRLVTDAAGGEHSYDTVVLATGAAPRLPALDGLDPAAPPRGVRTLRTIDDCRELLAAARPIRRDGSPTRLTVLGGGLLGLEAALGLAGQGLAVTVVHCGAHPLDRQLDAASGAVLGRCLADRRIRVRTRARAEGVTVHEQAVRELLLADGRRIDTDLLLVTAGVRPRVELAAAAGLDTDRGVVVGTNLRTPRDHRIAAIGDCAQPPTGCPGLLAPGWEQAATLARDLAAELSGEIVAPAPGDAGDQPGPAGEVVRLKSAHVDVVSFGTVPPPEALTTFDVLDADDLFDGPAGLAPPQRDDSGADSGPRVLQLLDVRGRRSIRLAVHDGRLVGGALVGAGSLGADLVVAFERGTPIPLDPAHLLVKGGSGGIPSTHSPAKISGSATICRCNGVTKSALVEAFTDGERSLAGLAGRTRATTGCGGCRNAVSGILDWLLAADPDDRHATASAPATDRADLTSRATTS